MRTLISCFQKCIVRKSWAYCLNLIVWSLLRSKSRNFFLKKKSQGTFNVIVDVIVFGSW